MFTVQGLRLGDSRFKVKVSGFRIQPHLGVFGERQKPGPCAFVIALGFRV